MNSRDLMTLEANEAKAKTFAEIEAMMGRGETTTARFAECVKVLAYYNDMLAKLGVGIG